VYFIKWAKYKEYFLQVACAEQRLAAEEEAAGADHALLIIPVCKRFNFFEHGVLQGFFAIENTGFVALFFVVGRIICKMWRPKL